MLMLRFVLRKINVLANSLIKYRFEKKANRHTSPVQNIAQTKARLQSSEVGDIPNWLIWLIILICGIFCLAFFWLNLSFWGSLGWGIGLSISITVVLPIAIRIAKYFDEQTPFASVRFRSNGLNGKVEFYNYNASQSNNSVIAKRIIKLAKGGRMSLNCGNSDIQRVEEVCKKVPRRLYNSHLSVKPNNNKIEVQFDSEIYICSVSFDN